MRAKVEELAASTFIGLPPVNATTISVGVVTVAAGVIACVCVGVATVPTTVGLAAVYMPSRTAGMAGNVGLTVSLCTAKELYRQTK